MPRFYLLTCSSQPGNPSFYVKWPRRHFKNPVKLAFSHSKGGEPGIGAISAFYCPGVLFLAAAGIGKATDCDVRGNAGRGNQGGLSGGEEVGSGF